MSSRLLSAFSWGEVERVKTHLICVNSDNEVKKNGKAGLGELEVAKLILRSWRCLRAERAVQKESAC